MIKVMRRVYLLCSIVFFALAGAAGCSGDTSGCKYDTECSGSMRCIDGVCKHSEQPVECAGVVCDPGQVCVDGQCLADDTDYDGDGYTIMDDCDDTDPDVYPGAAEVCNERDDDCDGYTDEDSPCDPDQVCIDGQCVEEITDEDGDGYTISDDCDDTDPDVNPGAAEVCNEKDDDCDGYTDEDLFCGEDCEPVDEPPASTPPADCDATTPCESCYVYESTNYYCRKQDQGEYAWLAIPQATPCNSANHCQTLTCEDDQHWHCDSLVGQYVAGQVPTDDPETCNGVDDDCDGQTDEAGVEDSCDEWANASVTCTDGVCQYTCNPGFHACSDVCLEDTSPDSCGSRCTPCLPPDNADAVCSAGECDFECRPGHLRDSEVCVPCNDDQACGIDCAPCTGGTNCCGDGCYDLLADPLNCGACDAPCPSAADTCCQGDGCCSSARPQCCGSGCCYAADQCCPGDSGDYCCETGGTCCTDHCCPAVSPNCCGQYCCYAGQRCCPGVYCCDVDETCCTDHCCPSDRPYCCNLGCCPPTHPNCCSDGCCVLGSPVCCGAGCCADGTTCCNDQYCCSPTYPHCCPDGCCQLGFPVCCGDGCCASGYHCCPEGCCPDRRGLAKTPRIPVLPNTRIDRTKIQIEIR